MLKSFRSSILLQLESLNFWELLVLSRWQNIRIHAPRIQNPARFHFTLFKLPHPGANIYVQRLLNFPTWGAQGCSKSPPHPVVPPSGITFIAALHELGTLRVRQNTSSFHNLYCPTTCFNVGIKIKNIHVKHH